MRWLSSALLLLWSMLLCIFGAKPIAGEVAAEASAAVVDIMEGGTTQDFQAEVSRLMDIIISSIYSQKDVFLRELVSNAADALEKVRFLAVANPSILDEEPDMRVNISVDTDEQTLTITDTGVGMSKDELINNLGTVARSGTTNFLEAVASGKADVNLIGQFGVGFYSAFLVADKVTVVSRPSGQERQYVWQSNGARFAVAEDPRGVTLTRGTEITLHLKDDATEFLLPGTIRDVVKRYNQFVQFPIFLQEEVPVEKNKNEKKDDGDELTDAENGGKEEKNDGDDDDEDKSSDEKEGAADETDAELDDVVKEWKQLNEAKPLWMRSKEDITDEEYKSFFKELTHSFEDPMSWIHFRAEGDVDFKALLYVPKYRAPEDARSGEQHMQRNVRIYARRVLVTDGLYEFLPPWLTFVHGIVDSDDLPLKVDRESLSQSRMLRAVSRKIVGKVLEAFKRLNREDAEAWADYRQALENHDPDEAKPSKPHTELSELVDTFSKDLKLGCIVDDSNRAKILKLFRFYSTKYGRDQRVSIDEVMERLPEESTDIYFISADSYEGAVASPHMQKFLSRGHEVIVLTDPFDEYCLQQFPDYNGKRFVNVEKSSPTLSVDEKEQHKKLSTVFKPLTNAIRKALKGKVSNVSVSNKLVGDAVALASPQWGNSAYLERLAAAQRFGQVKADDITRSRVLEINPSHPLIQKLLEVAREKGDNAAESLEGTAERLLDAAVINSGLHLQEPRDIVGLVMRALAHQQGVAESAAVQDYQFTAEDEELLAKKDAEKAKMPDRNMRMIGPDGQMQDDFDMEEFLEQMRAQKGEAAEEGSENASPMDAEAADAMQGGGEFDAGAQEADDDEYESQPGKDEL